MNISDSTQRSTIKGRVGRGHVVGGRFVLILFVFFLFHSCVAYAPVPAPSVYRVSSYQIAWEKAVSAAQDVGIQITSADEASGTIEGQSGRTDVTIRVKRQPEGRIRLEVSLRGPSQEAYIADEFHRAYERRVRGR
jgi:hypothetical protein